MNAITYTFPADHQIPALRGLIATDGKWATLLHQGKRVDAVAFANRINGQPLVAIVAGKPELEALLATHRAEEAARKAAQQQAAEAHANTLEGQREALARAEYNSYDPDAFPGSAKWNANKRAADALAAFDEAHTEIKAAVDAARKATEQARYAALSDFAKMGS
jgi:hypothetical protein